jgi:hypothetical protein
MITQRDFTRRRLADDDENDIFDERGIIKDGKRLRVPVHLMDAAPPRRSAPMSITTGLTGEHKLSKFFFPDGSAKPARKIRLRDIDEVEESERVTHDAHAEHKPGYRTADRAVVDAGQALKDAAYEEMVRDLSEAWKPAEQRIADARQMTADAACPAGVDPRTFFYEQGVREMCDAWRGDAAAVQNLPAGRYPLSAGEGNPCTIDGAAGTLQRDGQYLVCRAKPAIGPTRADSMPSRSMSAADAQRIKDEAYNEMVSDLTNAWKA